MGSRRAIAQAMAYAATAVTQVRSDPNVDLGVGTTTLHTTMTEESLTGSLREVFDSTVVVRALRRARQVSGDGAEIAAMRLEAEYGLRQR